MSQCGRAIALGFSGGILYFVVLPMLGLFTYQSGPLLALGVYFLAALPYLLVSAVWLWPASLGEGMRLGFLESSCFFVLAPLSLVVQLARQLELPLRHFIDDAKLLCAMFGLFSLASTLIVGATVPFVVKVLRPPARS